MSLQMVRSRTRNNLAARAASVQDVVRTVCSGARDPDSIPERLLAAGVHGS